MTWLGSLVFVTWISILFPLCEPARILGIFSVPSMSHQVVYRKLMLQLNSRGHEVTIVTTNPIENPPPNYNQIDIGQESYARLNRHFDFAKMVGAARPHPTTLATGFYEFFGGLAEIQLNMKQVQALLEPGLEFDLLVMEWLVTPLFLGFSHHFRIPVIGISSLGLYASTYDNMGSPTHPAYLPDWFLGTFKDLTFWERLESVYYEIHIRYQYYWRHMPRQDLAMRRVFGEDKPYLRDLEKNVSLVLSSSHFTTGHVRPLVPAIVEIGGAPILHLSAPTTLPQDLQEFLDSGKDVGVVYFSLGSNVKSSTMPESKRAMFLNAFRKINLKVLWKWETDDLPGKPDNVKLQKWLPQTDVLAHPSVKVFMTQGGLQSMGEATHFEKPMVVIPFFADQELNAKKLESVGVAVRIDFETMTEEDIVRAINDVAGNPKYKEAMAKYSALTRDQPESPMERAVWWTEYVLRHQGAHHLRSAAVDLPWYQYFLLDVLAFILAITLTTLFLIVHIVRTLCRLVFGKKKTKKE